ncbi:MAG: hypothetical protein JWM88_759 [Verrucomicrobia bacterium]|nr:hypothetical protein [Verrucomicrobiota bacterium]
MSASPTSLSSRRDAGLDSLRGLMLLAMGVNHIASLLQVLTDHPLGYTSSAEGFVFISGLVAGLVYTRRRRRLGVAAANRASLLRAATIYRYHLALFVGLLSWTLLFFAVRGAPAGNTPAVMLAHPGKVLLAGVFLVNQPPLLDILPMYAGFMLLLPLVLTALDAGRRRSLLALSLSVWALTNLAWPQTSYRHGVIQIGAFNETAWQLMFIAGVVCGHATAAGTEVLSRRLKSWLAVPSFALCVYAFLVRHWYVHAPFPGFADWVNKNNLAPFRLLNTLALFLLVHLAFARWPAAFSWRPLALLGRHSLTVFCTHVVVAYALYAFPDYVSTTPARTWIGTGIMIGALLSVAFVRERFRNLEAVREASGSAGEAAATVKSPVTPRRPLGRQQGIFPREEV